MDDGSNITYYRNIYNIQAFNPNAIVLQHISLPIIPLDT